MIGKSEDVSGIPKNIVDLVKDNKYFGQMNDPSGSAYIKGICGDQMEFYLVVENNKITDIKFHTEGCVYTTACGAMVCALAIGKYADLVWACRSREVRNILCIKAIEILSDASPVYILTQKGKMIVSGYSPNIFSMRKKIERSIVS